MSEHNARIERLMICSQRTDTPGFFTPCTAVLRGLCACGEAVRVELEEGT